MHYYLYYKDELSLDKDWGEWDLFLSAYNLSDRLSSIYKKINAHEKYWIIFKEYYFDEKDLPEGNRIIAEGDNEAQQMIALAKTIDFDKYKQKKICIDSTGFVRAQLLFLITYLNKKGFRNFDVIYSEPNRYSKKENTEFSEGSIYVTRQVIGFQGKNENSQKKDLLIIACGYDNKLISKICQQYENSDIVPLLGFPSLKADMFQESILQTIALEEPFGSARLKDPIFAPASDPFETAHAISTYIRDNKCIDNYGHIYLCPISTKPQVLGMGLVFIKEYEGQNISILYPFSEKYSKETSQGVAKVWKYTLEF